MSLRAVFKSHYFKAGTGKILTYLVQGTTAEIEEYKIIESARRNITVDKIACQENMPILFIAENGLLRGGELPQPSYNLVKNFNGTAYNRDTSAADMAKYQRIAVNTEKSMGELMAKRAMGIDIGDGAPRVQAAPRAAQAAPAVAETIGDDIADQIAGGVGAGEEHGEEIPAAVGEAGEENLGQ